MNQQAKKHLSRAVEVYRTGHKEAAKEITAAMKVDPQLTFGEVGKCFGRSDQWARRLVKWYQAGAEGPIDWGNDYRKNEQETVDKFLETASPAELRKRLGTNKMIDVVAGTNPVIIAKAVGKSPELATAITEDKKANDNMHEAFFKKIRGSHKPDYFGESTKDKRSLPIKMEDFSTQSDKLAKAIALTWRDDAPVTSPKMLLFARDIVADIILDFENTITEALRETNTPEFDNAR